MVLKICNFAALLRLTPRGSRHEYWGHCWIDLVFIQSSQLFQPQKILMKTTTKTLSFVALAACSASAATITWDAAVINTTAADIITDGSLHIAVDAASSNDNTINGVTFVGGNPLASNAEGSFWTQGGVTTGDVGLDDLLNSHSYTGGNPSLASFDINSLTVGDSYAIQIIAVGDTRNCCAGRTQNYDGGGGISADLTRSDPASVVGFFVADGVTQTITVNGSQDGGLSGYQVRNVTIPEPSSALLSLVGLLGLAARRRR